MKFACVAELDGAKLDYILDLSKRSRGSLSIKNGVLSVRLPMIYPTLTDAQKAAQQLILSHKAWVLEKLEQSENASHMPQSFENGEGFSLLGKKRTLEIVQSAEYRPIALADDKLTVYICQGMSKDDVERLFWQYTSLLCKEKVDEAFNKYMPILQLYPKRITIKRMTSRWGSCSSNQNISINLDVVCFEQRCIEYVVVHELCHLKYMNHSDDFWRLVSSCFPDYKEIREIMKH
ncbi:MAG: M48 family metallopeptidase [Ruminococcus sp.]|nr:M48 family metallopeptidase [Ruminococcus sp.]